MIILGRQELKPSIVQAPQAEWEKSLDHTTETSLPLVELAQRHARGAVAPSGNRLLPRVGARPG